MKLIYACVIINAKLNFSYERRKNYMKKSIKALTLGLLTVSMLAGCNKQAPDPTWSDEVKEMMTQNLHGVILPYLSLSNMEATVDEGMINVVADELDGSALAAYAEKFTVEEGWVNMLESDSTSSSAFLGEEAAYPDHYVFEKEVMVPGEEEGEQVKRFVDVSFGNEKGEFVAQAGDPYLYEFPALALMISVYKMTGGQVVAEFPEPAFTVDAYAYNSDLGIFLTKNASVKHPADSYKDTISAFEKEGKKVYIVDEGEDEHSYVAYDETQMYVLGFYEVEDEMMFGIGNFTDWPSIALANLLKEHFGELQDSVPACASDKFKTVFAYDDDLSVKLEVLLPDGLTIADAEAAYETLLLKEEAGYEAAELAGHEGYRSEHSELFIYFSDYSEDEEPMTDRFVINILSPESALWPQAEIDAYKVEKKMETLIPAYVNPNALFVFDDSYKAAGGYVEVDVYGVGTDFTAYEDLLKQDDLYKLAVDPGDGRKVYESALRPDTRILLMPDKDINGFDIVIWGLEVDSSFPAAKLAAEYSVEQSIFPTPALEGADFWVYTSVYETERVVTTGYFDTADHATAAVATLSEAYEADTENWLMVSEGNFANVANPEFTVSIKVSSDDTKQITVTFNRIRYFDSFADATIEFLTEYGFVTPVPVYNIFAVEPEGVEENEWKLQRANSAVTYVITEFESEEEAAAFVAAYNAKLEADARYEWDDTYKTYAYFTQYGLEFDLYAVQSGTIVGIKVQVWKSA